MWSLENAGDVGRVAYGFSMLSLGLGIVLASSGSFAAEGESASKTLRIEVVGQALSVQVSDAPLHEVLREVAQQAGFEIEMRGRLGEVPAQKFEGVLLDQAIRRLVGENQVNLIMRYELDETGERRLVEVTARAAGEVPAAFLEQRRMRTELSRVPIPPPPPPPPTIQ